MSLIPKKIHYIWFGKNKKSKLIERCILSWEKNLPDWEIIEWNEENFDIEQHPFTKKAYAEKKWAFLSDYIRMKVLYEYGGIYLDTDMEILKSLENFRKHQAFIGIELDTNAAAAIIGTTQHHWLPNEMLKRYDNQTNYEVITNMMTDILKNRKTLIEDLQFIEDLAIYPREYFYPFSYLEKYSPECITPNTHTIHWWNHSWASNKVKFLKKTRLINIIKAIKNKLATQK